MSPISILYLEDSPLDMELALSHLTRAGIPHQARRVQTEQAFLAALHDRCDDLILADYALPEFDGASALRLAREHCPETPFVFVSGAIGEEVAIDSLHSGATDYVLKHRLGRLPSAVTRALNEANERRARRKAEAERKALLEREQAAREEAEARARELALVNNELEQFAYAASHDLQEPLRTIKIYTQLLARRYAGSIDSSGAEFIGFIEGGVDRMLRMIHDLLAYSRISHDQSRKLQPVDLGAVLRRTLDDLGPSLQENEAHVAVGELPTVLGDGERISHVFQNLLSNSLKYRTNSTPQIEVSARNENAEWVVAVKDNGIGFEQQYAENVFGLFRRLHGSEIPGTGVGLAIAKKVIEQHGGRIWAESVPNHGTVFSFTMKPVESVTTTPSL